MEHYDGWGNVFFEPTVNILIFFYCSSVVGSYLKKSVPLFKILFLSAQPPPVRCQQPSGRGPAPAPAAWGGGWKTKPPIPVPGRPVSYVLLFTFDICTGKLLMQEVPLALILIKFANSSVNMKCQGLVKHCLQVWLQDPRRRTTPGWCRTWCWGSRR